MNNRDFLNQEIPPTVDKCLVELGGEGMQFINLINKDKYGNTSICNLPELLDFWGGGRALVPEKRLMAKILLYALSDIKHYWMWEEGQDAYDWVMQKGRHRWAGRHNYVFTVLNICAILEIDYKKVVEFVEENAIGG